VLNILEIRATEASKQMNVEMQKLTEQGVNENKLMKKLTEQTTQDTKSMMIISLISAVFLPATFLAVISSSLSICSKAEARSSHYLDLTSSFTLKTETC